MSRIGAKFDELRAKNEKPLIAYIMSGDPSLEDTERLVLELEASGADIIELGVPFSDPMADGPVIQRAAERALARGVTLHSVIDLVRKLREKTAIPLILMTYYNPVLKYGEERFAADAADAGVDGIIVPDLIADEADSLIAVCRPKGIDTIFLLAPTSTPERVEIVAKASRGFLYYVTITGITGSALVAEMGMRERIREISAIAGLPVALGFGIATPDDAAWAASVSDGVIVGSAIVKKIAAGDDMKAFVSSLKEAMRQPQ